MSVNMTTQTIAVGDNWTKVGDEYVGDNPLGVSSFGDAALGGSISGSTITVSTDGTYSFGAKTQAAPLVYDLGDSAYVNGVEDTSMAVLLEGQTVGDAVNTGDLQSTIWEAVGNTVGITRTGLRHNGVGFHYKAISDSNYVGEAFASGGVNRAPQTNEVYVSWFYRAPYKSSSYTEIAITNQVGTFETAVDGGFAEDLIVTGATDVSYMKLIDVFNDGTDKVAIEATRGIANDDSGIGTPNVSGASIEGAISGATADLDPSTYILSYGGSSKFARVWDTDNGVGGIRHSWTQSQYTTEGTDDQTNTSPTPNEWNQLELHIDVTGNQVDRWLNGSLIASFAPSDTRTSGNSPTIKQIGVDGKQTYNLPEFGEIYLDSTPQRMVIGNASTWAACTIREPQLLATWGDAGASAGLRVGFSGNRWLYMIGISGSPVTTTGVALP